MVMNSNLTPHTINIVIGEGLYELKFHVEMNAEVGNPQPMEMDANHQGDDSDHMKDKVFNHKEKHATFGPKARYGGSSNNVKRMNVVTCKQVAQALPIFLIQAHPSLEQEGGGASTQDVFGTRLGFQSADNLGGVLNMHTHTKAKMPAFMWMGR
jgi:hypothetical protein